jgi:ectoine hydroxylase-related dioxygenase (phytanoyl-CoA dioxygenase family)
MSQDTQSLPDLSAEYPLTEEQRAAYQRDGHILLRGVCSPEEVAAYRPVLTGTVARHNRETRKLEDRDTYGKAFLQIGNLWRKDEAARGFVFARRFARIAAELMEVDGVRLYHDQALYKEAGGGHTPWHQDQYYWPLDTNNTITMWMPLVDVSVDMGPVTFASGSHKEGFLGHIAISDDSEAYFDRFVKERGYPVVCQGMRAGDATFHSGWTLHSAPGNASRTDREVMTIIYYPDGIRTIHPDNENRWADFRAFYPGMSPGELAVSEMTPLLYQRESDR